MSKKTSEKKKSFLAEHEGSDLRHGIARYEPLCPADARQHGASVHPDHDGRHDRHPDPAAILQPAPAALRRAADLHLEARLLREKDVSDAMF